MAYSRTKLSVTNIEPVSVTKEKVTVTKPLSVTKLVFSHEPLEERIEKYLDLYPESKFIPNWIANGFNSQEDAIKKAISDVRKKNSIEKLGLGVK